MSLRLLFETTVSCEAHEASPRVGHAAILPRASLFRRLAVLGRLSPTVRGGPHSDNRTYQALGVFIGPQQGNDVTLTQL